MSVQEKIVVIGGVATGPKAAARARRLLPNAEITVVEQGSLISYGSCGIPLFLAGMVGGLDSLITTASGVTRDREYFAKEKRINFLIRTVAEGINRSSQEVFLFDLERKVQKKIDYDYLVLATGAKPIIPAIPGIELPGVTVLHHPDDALLIRDNLKQGINNIVIIGGGLIGLEVAAALVSAKRRVVLVERESQLLPGLLDPEVARLVQDEVELNRVDVRTGDIVTAIEADGMGKKRVVLENETLEADLVIIACGVRPNVELARGCDLAIGSTGAIKVDDYLRTSDPNIYAAGDCVENRHLVTGRQVYVPLASTANKQGRVVGSNIAGMQEIFPGIIGTGVFQLFEFNGGKTGLTEKEAKSLGYKVVTSFSVGLDSAHFHPLHGGGLVKLIACADTRKLLGAQVVGHGEVIKRLDVLSTGIQLGVTFDQMASLDLAYAPPFATPIDLGLHAINTLRNKYHGILQGIDPSQFEKMLKSNTEFLVLDVRTPEEAADRPLRLVDNILQIPLYELRQRLEEIPREGKIITLCELGIRAYEAQQILLGAGYKEVICLEAGVYGLPRRFFIN